MFYVVLSPLWTWELGFGAVGRGETNGAGCYQYWVTVASGIHLISCNRDVTLHLYIFIIVSRLNQRRYGLDRTAQLLRSTRDVERCARIRSSLQHRACVSLFLSLTHFLFPNIVVLYLSSTLAPACLLECFNLTRHQPPRALEDTRRPRHRSRSSRTRERMDSVARDCLSGQKACFTLS